MLLLKPKLLLLFTVVLAIAIREDNLELPENKTSIRDANSSTTKVTLEGSAREAAAIASFYMRPCFFGKCQEKLDASGKQFIQNDLGVDTNPRTRRDLDYINPVLAAILDTFVENELKEARHNEVVNNEVYPSLQPEPSLVTLAKYFDKYADDEVKKHVKIRVRKDVTGSSKPVTHTHIIEILRSIVSQYVSKYIHENVKKLSYSLESLVSTYDIEPRKQLLSLAQRYLYSRYMECNELFRFVPSVLNQRTQ